VKRPPKGTWPNLVFFSVFTLAVSAMGAAFLYPICVRLCATTYPPTPALVTRNTYSGARTYRETVSFRYQIEARGYAASESGPGVWAGGYPIRGPVTAYYNPSNPSIAVLDPGLRRDDGAVLLVSAWVAAIVLEVWISLAGLLGLTASARWPIRSLRVRESGATVRARLPSLQTPLEVAVLWSVAWSFAAWLPVVFIYRKAEIPAVLPAVVVAAGLAVGAAIYARRRWSLRAGRRDLIIDRARRVIELPPCVTRIAPSVPFDFVLALEVVPGNNIFRGGPRCSRVVLVTAVLQYNLTSRPRYDEARAIADWVKQAIEAPSRPQEAADQHKKTPALEAGVLR
jgi:hypothetical protein